MSIRALLTRGAELTHSGGWSRRRERRHRKQEFRLSPLEHFEDRLLLSGVVPNGIQGGTDVLGPVSFTTAALGTVDVNATPPTVDSVNPNLLDFTFTNTGTQAVTVGLATYQDQQSAPPVILDQEVFLSVQYVTVPANGQPVLVQEPLQSCVEIDAFLNAVGSTTVTNVINNSTVGGTPAFTPGDQVFPGPVPDGADAGYNYNPTTGAMNVHTTGSGTLTNPFVPPPSTTVGTLLSFIQTSSMDGINGTCTPVTTVTKTADTSSIVAGGTAGYTVTINNTAMVAINVTLTDPLPPGAGNDINWKIDPSKGTPADFVITGGVGSQSLSLSPSFISSGDFLLVGQSISVHITGVTTAKDVGTSSSPSVNPALNVGGAATYAVLYEGTGNNQLSVNNDTIDGNIGVGGGQVQFNGPGTINGRVDFAAANSGQFHSTNGSNVGPTSVNYNVSAVTTAINAVNSLSTALGGLAGTNISFNNANQTVNESSGTLETSNGVTYRVFNVTSYSENNSDTVTIHGDGSGDPVVFNFAYSSNTNLGGQVVLTGGLTTDQVVWNFTSANKQVQLNNNGGTFKGVLLLPKDQYQSNNSNLDGRVYGGAAGNMQIVSGANVFVPLTATLPNTAMVSAFQDTGQPGQQATATITIGSAAPQLAAGSNSQAGAGLTELLDAPGSLQAGAISFAVNLPQGPQAAAVQAGIALAVSELNAEVAPLGLSLVQVSGADAGAAQVQISFASSSPIGGVSQGVIGAYTPGQITLINGWNWYFGSDASGIGQNQYDFQTVVTHELGHVLGLGENSDASSAMDLYLGAGQVRRDLTANDVSAIQQGLQTSAAALPTSLAATASGGASTVAMASPSPVMAVAASGTGATDLAGPAAADLEGFSATAGAIPVAPRPLVVPGLETLGDGETSQAGPLLLAASPTAVASDGAMLVAAGSPSSSVMTASATVLGGAAAAVPQGLSGVARLFTLAGLEIAASGVMTDPIYGLGSAASTWMPLSCFDANGLAIELGIGVQRTGLDDPPAADHASTPAVPAVMPFAPLTWLAAPSMSDPMSDALDSVLVQNWSGLDGTPEEADGWAARGDLNTAPVVMSILGLAWSWRSHLGRSENDRDRRRSTDPQRRLSKRGLGLDHTGNRN